MSHLEEIDHNTASGGDFILEYAPTYVYPGSCDVGTPASEEDRLTKLKKQRDFYQMQSRRYKCERDKLLRTPYFHSNAEACD